MPTWTLDDSANWWPELRAQILQHFKGKGWFRSADVRALINRRPANLLRSMEAQGELVKRGNTNAARYRLADDFWEDL
jgi:hypothetical protein